MSATAAATIEPRDPALMTLEAWADMDEDEPGELVDGRIEEEEVASVLHETVVSWFIGELRTWAVPRGGKVYGSELKLAVSSSRGRKPDVSMYAPGARLLGKRASLVKQPPSVLIEVLSPRPKDARRDRVEKLREYARFGVRYYWLVDPELRVLEVLELGPDQRYTIVLSASDGSHAIPGFEGLTVDLDALWAEIDALPEEDEDAGSEGKATE
jgi:Uma2 family endonuclease